MPRNSSLLHPANIAIIRKRYRVLQSLQPNMTPLSHLRSLSLHLHIPKRRVTKVANQRILQILHVHFHDPEHRQVHRRDDLLEGR